MYSQRTRKKLTVMSLRHCHSVYLTFMDGRQKNVKRVIVPQSLRNLVMAENHSGPCSGHFAGYHMLVRHWYWKGMYEDIMSYCCNCPQCVFVSGSGRHVKPPLRMCIQSLLIGHYKC